MFNNEAQFLVSDVSYATRIRKASEDYPVDLKLGLFADFHSDINRNAIVNESATL